jgi:putative oxidoreductase
LRYNYVEEFSFCISKGRYKLLIYTSIGLLFLRLVVGLLFAGHGAQKLFGWFGGHGLAGYIKLIESQDFHPAAFWAWISALSEFLGGLALASGLFTPLAATVLIGTMLVAIVKVHWPNGFWNTNRGYEFPLVLAVVAFVVGLIGPGLYSLDYALGLALPEPLTYLAALVIMLVVVVIGLWLPGQTAPEQEPQPQ